jgi:MraZ protein
VGYVPSSESGRGRFLPPLPARLAPVNFAGHPLLSALQLQSQFELTLDAKNRLTIPARFRDPFKAGLVLVRSHDVPAVGIEPVADYASFVEQSLAGRHPLDPSTRQIERFLNSAATPAELDGQGRVTIGQGLLEHARIAAKDVLLVGSGRRFELWDRTTWSEYQPQLQDAMLDIANAIGGQPWTPTPPEGQ